MTGIVSWGTYVPRGRMDRAALAAMFRVGGARGSRSVAGPDEDALTMGVEAARRALAARPDAATLPTTWWFASAHPPMFDKGNASWIAAANGMHGELGAYDVGGSLRSGVAALSIAATGTSIAVLSDVRSGRPGSDDETIGGDGAAAFVFGDDPLVTIESTAAVTSPVLDRWRNEGDVGSSVWDDRWTAEHQAPLMLSVATTALEQAGLTTGDLDGVVVSCPSARVEQQVLAKLGVPFAESDPRASIGFTGSADVGVRLSAALDVLRPGGRVLVLTGADGADALVLRGTDRLTDRASSSGEPEPTSTVEPATYLVWRGLAERAPVRRPPVEPPAAPAVARREEWKFGFVGSACRECGTRHLPPQRVCMSCGRHDEMDRVDLRDAHATVRTFTIDRLAASLDPPVVVGVVDFDGGGRYRCQLTDVVPEQVGVGDRVEMVYRLVSIASNGVRNYFWKARPLATRSDDEPADGPADQRETT